MGRRKKICIVPYGTKTTKGVVKGLSIIKDAQGAVHAVIKKRLRKLKASSVRKAYMCNKSDNSIGWPIAWNFVFRSQESVT